MSLTEIFKRADISLEEPPLPMVIIGDFAKDLDDEMTLVLAAALQRVGLIELRAVVGNLEPAAARAQVAKGTLRELGLGHVPVGVGQPVFSGTVHPYELNVPYKAELSELEDGPDLLLRTLESAEPKSLCWVLQSGLTDAAYLLRDHPRLCRDRVKRVVIMGGIRTEEVGGQSRIALKDGRMEPDDANNNTFDFESAVQLFESLQDLSIPISILTRQAAYACQVPFSIYDAMAATGHSVGVCLMQRQQPAIQELWEAACSPPGSDVRGTLPDNRDRSWFIEVFCDGGDPGVSGAEEIWPHVHRFNLYDPLNFLAGVPALCRRFFEPAPLQIGEAAHEIFGLSPEQSGIADEDGLRDFLTEAAQAVLIGSIQISS